MLCTFVVRFSYSEEKGNGVSCIEKLRHDDLTPPMIVLQVLEMFLFSKFADIFLPSSVQTGNFNFN